MRTLPFLAAFLLAGCGVAGQAADTSGLPFNVTKIAEFDGPWAIAFFPDGRALVTETAGKLKLWSKSGAIADVAGVPAVDEVGQGGLLDVALSPHFGSDHIVYLTYSEPGPGGTGLALAKARLAEGPSGARLDGLRVIWRQEPRGKGGQFGAIVTFSPDGNLLYLTSGERQRFTPAQDPNQAIGKILRLTPDGKPAPDNPWAGKTGAAEVNVIDPPDDTEAAAGAHGRTEKMPGPNLTPAETWTMGHRNPYGLAFAPDGRLWEIEMGPRGGDELNLIERGKNYGWPVVSQGDNYDGKPIQRHATHPEFQPPALFWNPSISPAGLIFYSGNLFPQWKGSAFLGALSGQALIRVTVNGASAQKADQWDMGTRIRDVAQGPDGAIYLLEDGKRGSGGHLLRLTPKH